jgi:hypothetical protein
VNDNDLTPHRFEWQDGYGVFSYEYCEEKQIVTMTNGHQADISRRRKRELKGF